MSKFRLIIDADPLVYRCGFAAEKHSYELVVSTPEGLEQLSFDDGAAMKVWKKTNMSQPDVEIIGQEMLVQEQPKHFALQIMGVTIRALVEAVEAEFQITNPLVTVLLSGQDNFREDIATVRGYKANRKETAKPYWYQAIRNYLTDHWNAKVIDGREADDECSIMAVRATQDSEPYCIATTDKDMDQVPGWHYDYAKKVFYDVDPEEAQILFWKQVLSGDSVDNIPGATKIGAKIAGRLVDEWVSEGKTPEHIWQAIVVVYDDSKRHDTCEYAGLKAEDVALEMARLVYLQQKPGELWTAPGKDNLFLKAQLDD